jgi:hypothetical protein
VKISRRDPVQQPSGQAKNNIAGSYVPTYPEMTNKPMSTTANQPHKR